LLVGHGWGGTASLLNSLERSGIVHFVGPATGSFLAAAANARASIIIAAPDSHEQVREELDREARIMQRTPPPVLYVIVNTELDPNALVLSEFDDFIVMPAGTVEMAIRIRRMIGRAEEKDGRLWTVGELSLDPRTYRVSANGQSVVLSWIEFHLLKLLMTQPGKVFSRDEIMAEVWAAEYVQGSRTVDVHIRRLRNKLGTHADYIKTVKKVGYTLTNPGPVTEPAPVTLLHPSAPRSDERIPSRA
jgi:DNA-binding response OmpR family regulator